MFYVENKIITKAKQRMVRNTYLCPLVVVTQYLAGVDNLTYAPIFIGERYNQIWPKREGYKKFRVLNLDCRIEAGVVVTLKRCINLFINLSMETLCINILVSDLNPAIQLLVQE